MQRWAGQCGSYRSRRPGAEWPIASRPAADPARTGSSRRAGSFALRRAGAFLCPALSAVFAGAGLTSLFSARAFAQDTTPLTRLVELGLSPDEPRGVASVAFIVGLTVFAITVAVLHIHARNLWTRRHRALSDHAEDTELALDRAKLFLNAERQVFIVWAGEGEPPVIEGDPSFIGIQANLNRLLAFGAWLPPDRAGAIEAALDRLRGHGEGFDLAMQTNSGHFLEAQGRAVAGRAVLRLRETTGDRLELQKTSESLRKLSEEADTLRALLEALPGPAWRRDRLARLAWVNASYAHCVEATDARDAAARGLELLERADRERCERALRDGSAFHEKLNVVVAGQRRLHDVLSVQANGGSAGMALDVSGAEALEADLERQAKAHALLIDRLPTAVVVFDGAKRIAAWNSAYRDMWQLDEAYLRNAPTDGEILDRLRTERRLPEQGDYRAWKNQILSGYHSVETREDWWYPADGRALRVVSSPNPQGGVTYMFDDVTERMRLAAQFEALTRVQSETLDTLKEAVAVFGPDGKLKLHNLAFLTSWKLSPTLLKTGPHVDAIIDLCRTLAPDAKIWEALRAMVTGLSDQRQAIEKRLMRSDASQFDVAAAPLPDGATLVTFTDVTDKVSAEKALRERNEALERAANLRDDFVHLVSYELRSPLTNIIGFSQLLRDQTVGPLNERQLDYAGHISRSSAALLAIVTDILDLATIDKGSIDLELGAVDVRETMSAAAEGVQDRLAEAGIRLEIASAPEIGTFVGDKKRVRQVLFNLLSNAIGFSSSGQTVRLKAERQGSEVVFTVSDEGRGIPEELKGRVFDRFESHTTGARHRGLGLGLSIVRSFVELHGGRVWLDSSPGRGTTVICSFPDAAVPARQAS
ncbi:Signal transduction histidine kinase [Rhizobiales bacterium GAS188]|nr:Signal transduction histidine kinase [Rhizobiales bacterium GAS188]